MSAATGATDGGPGPEVDGTARRAAGGEVALAQARPCHPAWSPVRGYLNASTLGLPPRAAVTALSRALAEWQAGTASPARYDEDVIASRIAYADLVGVPSSQVAVGSQVSVMVGLVAASLPSGARVVTATGEFSSVTAPLQVQAGRGVTVHAVPTAAVPAAVEAGADAVVVSLAQSATGECLDQEALADAAARAGALTVVDTTQAVGWLPVDASAFDITVCSAYKWLCCPRGSAFMTVRPQVLSRLMPLAAGWYAGEDVWESCYGLDILLAGDARRLDVSPVWLSWVGTRPALEVFRTIPVEQRLDHGCALADRFRQRLGLEPQHRPVVALDDPDGHVGARLTAAGCAVAARAGRARVAFHLWNDDDDVDLAARALGV